MEGKGVSWGMGFLLEGEALRSLVSEMVLKGGRGGLAYDDRMVVRGGEGVMGRGQAWRVVDDEEGAATDAGRGGEEDGGEATDGGLEREATLTIW
ncbi:uncharacterized protein G2W53_015500 [Senna tora]|uniref:Uncharacterized protein n=1 Tax=Senna tora TaxID=362788 RepID=A0A834WVM4_9FABA|nr:uncharacterized protein G2W53_015500 [Senna tora]